MKKSKRGVTLVELIICCSIIVMIGGACTAVIASGSHIFNRSTSTAHAQMESDVLQTLMMKFLPSANNLKCGTGEIDNMENLFYVNENNDMIIRIEGKDTTIRSVSSFDYEVVPAGSAASTSARAQLNYSVTFEDGSCLSGGFVLSNYKYAQVAESDKSGSLFKDDSLSDNQYHFICFDPKPETTN